LIDVFEAPISNSLYLADELIRLVTDSEENGDAVSPETSARLSGLRRIFAATPDVELIDQAINLVEMADELSEGDSQP
jgi:hypothetical protein